MARNSLIVIAGPTASGKSKLAVKIAKKISGEVISADSRQVYRGLDIGTAKITHREMRVVKHYCLDIANPKNIFTVEQYRDIALKNIEIILKRHKTPIIVGGTGFYIDAILYDRNFPKVAPDWKLRKKLASEPVEKLFTMLEKLDPRRAKTIDPKNPRRLIRAIEIVKKTGKPIPIISKTPRYKAKTIFLNPPLNTLKKNIASRTEKMLKTGLVAEVTKLRKKLSRARLLELGFEYKYPLLFLEGKISKLEMTERINTETWHYAKRQITWFKKIP